MHLCMDLCKTAFIQFSHSRLLMPGSEVHVESYYEHHELNFYIKTLGVSFEGSYGKVLDLFFLSCSDVSTPAVWALDILSGRNGFVDTHTPIQIFGLYGKMLLGGWKIFTI